MPIHGRLMIRTINVRVRPFGRYIHSHLYLEAKPSLSINYKILLLLLLDSTIVHTIDLTLNTQLAHDAFTRTKLDLDHQEDVYPLAPRACCRSGAGTVFHLGKPARERPRRV